MSDETTVLNILIAEMPDQLICTTPGCTYGDGGVPYKTQPLEFDSAEKMLDRHRADAHGVQAPRDGGAAGGVRTHLSKIPRPEISGGSSQEDFRQFKVKWNQYVRASNVTDADKLRDDLMHCPEAALEKAVHRALGSGSRQSTWRISSVK